jgi:hypothetical protein
MYVHKSRDTSCTGLDKKHLADAGALARGLALPSYEFLNAFRRIIQRGYT